MLYNSSFGFLTDALAPTLVEEDEISSTLVFSTGLYFNSTYSAFVALVNRTTGDFLHNTTLQGNNSRAIDILINNSDVYVVGLTQAEQFEGINVPGSQGAFVIKFHINTNTSSPYLEKVWTIVFGGVTSSTSASSVSMQGSDIIVFGTTDGNSLDGVVSNQTGSTNKLFLRKMSSQGNLIWTRFVNGGTAWSRSVITDSQNNIYISAVTLQGSSFCSGGYSGLDFVVIKTDPLGNVTWCQKIGSPSDDDVAALMLQEDMGLVVILGYADYSSVKDASGEILRDGYGLNDVLVLKYTMTQGQFVQGSYFGTQYSDWGLGIVKNSANNLVMLWHTDQTNTYSISKFPSNNLTAIYNYTFFPSPYLDGSIAAETGRTGYFYVAGLSSAPVSPTTVAIFSFYDGYPDVTASPSPSTSPSSALATPSHSSSNNSEGHKNAVIIISVCVVVGSLLLLGSAGAALFLIRRRRRTRDQAPPEVDMSEKKQSNVYTKIPGKSEDANVPLSNSQNAISHDYPTMTQTVSAETKTSARTNYDTHSLPLEDDDVATQRKPTEPKFSGWEIDFNELKFVRELGRGAFGVVYLCRWRNTDCVAKQLDFSKLDDQFVYRFLKEAENVKGLKPHPNICPVFGVCTNRQYPICIVMEYMPDGNLLDLLQDKKIQITVNRLVSFAKDIASGMGHLHAENILHCDLACRNLLVASKGSDKYQIKIADFGLSRVLESETYTVSHQATFPTRWTAPETFATGKISRANDVWSFGVVLWEIMEQGRRPYMEYNNAEIIQKVTSGYRLPRPSMQIPDALWDLVLWCWNPEPANRPSFNDIYEQLAKLEEEMTV